MSSDVTQENRSKRWERPARFLVFGSVNTLIAYLLYLLLLQLLPYVLAYSIAYVVGIFTSYCLNARFVFNQKLQVAAALRYPVIYIVQYVLGLGLLYALVERAGMPEVIAPFVIAILMIPVGYLLSRYIITTK